ncbi:MAG: hypothetical protein ACO4CI_07290, partial [Phycisphaerales bacterium]
MSAAAKTARLAARRTGEVGSSDTRGMTDMETEAATAVAPPGAPARVGGRLVACGRDDRAPCPGSAGQVGERG